MRPFIERISGAGDSAEGLCDRHETRQDEEMRAALEDVMEGRATERPTAIESSDGGEPPVLATDRVGAYGAAFRFSVSHRGDWYGDAIYARKDAGGRWEDMGGGGTRGSGWNTPWTPTPQSWADEDVYLLGQAGLSVEDESGEAGLVAVFGFAALHVDTIRVDDGPRSRAVPLTSPVGAFVILRIGRGSFRMTPLHASGEAGRDRLIR